MIKYAELRKKGPSLKMPECGVNIWMNRSQWDDMLNTPIIIMPLHYYFKRVTLSRRPRPVCSDARTFRVIRGMGVSVFGLCIPLLLFTRL